MTTDKTLKQAIAHHQAGQLQDAEKLYLAILQSHPNHPEANHNMGVLAVQTKQPLAGLSYLMAALEANPTQRQYWLSYIDALFQADQLEAAREVLALAQQHGLQGDEIDALSVRLEGNAPVTEQTNAEYQHAAKESLPVSKAALKSSKKKSKSTLTKAEKSAKKSARHKGNKPSSQEINILVALFAEGRYPEAATLAQAMTVHFPRHEFGWKALGAVFQKIGRNADALMPMQKAATLSPGDAEAHNNLGNTLQELGRLDEAEASCRRALKIKPDFAEAHNNLGNTIKDLGRLDEAVVSYRRALEIKPDFAEAHSNLGLALQELGRLDEAEASYRRALEIKPDYAEAHNNLGLILNELDWLDEAEAIYRRALQIKPDFAEAHNNLGLTIHDLGRLDEAEAIYRRALQIKPDFAEAHINLGSALSVQGRLSDAKACYRKAWELGFNGARILNALILPAIIGTRQEMLESREEFERNLDELIAQEVILDDPLKSVGEANFYLAYHGLNDRDLQVKVAKYYEQTSPSLLYTAPHCLQPKSGIQKKIRVGFLSKFLYNHSVSLCFSKIIETVSLKEQFEVTLISSHPIDKKIYSEFSGQRMRLPNNLELARKMLAALELDILVYLDIGMEPLSYFLAFSRLAHAQCVMGGHPVTTGITNMDYFLSADLMEPSGAEEHYSEKLIRLPRPLFYFPRPKLPVTFKTRHELGLPEGRHIYMCPMKLQKIHPDFDAALTRILQIDDNGVVVLFEDNIRPYWKKALVKRFESTIPAEVRERIIFLPWLNNPDDFISAIATADVILDPFHFGIGSTTAMVFATSRPLVTKPGEFLRGRVGAGFCEMLDLTECIAEDTEGYAKKAVEIASDQRLQEKIGTKILKNSPVLYENLQPVEDLVAFFYSLTDNRHTALSDKKDKI